MADTCQIKRIWVKHPEKLYEALAKCGIRRCDIRHVWLAASELVLKDDLSIDLSILQNKLAREELTSILTARFENKTDVGDYLESFF